MTRQIITDTDLAADSELWLNILPAVRIAIERGAVPDPDFDRWEKLSRRNGTLASDVLIWLRDAMESSSRSTAPQPFTSEERETARRAYAAIISYSHINSGDAPHTTD